MNKMLHMCLIALVFASLAVCCSVAAPISIFLFFIVGAAHVISVVVLSVMFIHGDYIHFVKEKKYEVINYKESTVVHTGTLKECNKVCKEMNLVDETYIVLKK